MVGLQKHVSLSVFLDNPDLSIETKSIIFVLLFVANAHFYHNQYEKTGSLFTPNQSSQGVKTDETVKVASQPDEIIVFFHPDTPRLDGKSSVELKVSSVRNQSDAN
jgi:hypothetical protein